MKQDRKHSMKKIMCMLLAVVLFASIVPMSAFSTSSSHENQVKVIVENTVYPAKADLEADEGAAWDGKLVEAWVTIDETSTLLSTVTTALGFENVQASCTVNEETGYISEINGLYAGENDDYSGWMCALNDCMISGSITDYTVEDETLEEGDEIRIMYSNDMGADLGASVEDDNKTVKSVTFSTGTLDREFSSEDKESYLLTVPYDTESIVITPTAANRYFQVRIFADGTEYKRTAEIPVEDGTVITVSCGDSETENYTFYVSFEDAPTSGGKLLKEQENTAPSIIAGIGESLCTDIYVGRTWSIDLTTIFEDQDGDSLSYQVIYANGTSETLESPVYTYAASETGVVNFEFLANDGSADSSKYLVSLNIVQRKCELSMLTVHTGSVSTVTESNILLGNSSLNPPVLFDSSELTYTLPAKDDSLKLLNFRAIPSDAGDKVTISYQYNGEIQTQDITWSSGNSKQIFLSTGKNKMELTVSSSDASAEETTYVLYLNVLPTLSGLSLSSSAGKIILDQAFHKNTYSYEAEIPSHISEVTVSAPPTSSDYELLYNGSSEYTLDISEADEINVTVSTGADENALSSTYIIHLNKQEASNFKIEPSPSDAAIQVLDGNGNTVSVNEDGSYTGLFASGNYTYIVSKSGYITVNGTVPAEGGTIQVSLEKAASSTLKDVGAYWPSFRGSGSNMAISSVKLPRNEDVAEVSLKWSKKIGSSLSEAPSVSIIVDDALITMSGKTIYKLDLDTGEILQSGQMAASPSYAYTAPTYADGMIFCPLGGGTIQAFNAETLESLWVYSDPLKGQALSPIVCSDGYVYVGFWNGEDADANFVCVSVTDEDPSKTDETKQAVWKHTQTGGFYWAGAVVVEDAVIVGTDDGTSGSTGNSKLYSFNKYNGQMLSSLDLIGDQRSSIAYDAGSGKIYFTTKAGYLYSAQVNASTGNLSSLKGVNCNAQSTSTPVVYKNRVYFGVGSGISSSGSSGYFVAADADTLELLFTAELKGYPQCSMLMTNAYESETGYLYFYSTYNAKPGGISVIKVKADCKTSADATVAELYIPASDSQEFCIASIICDAEGTLYYKNDSSNIFAVGIPSVENVEKLISAIGTVTLKSSSAIEAAREAYDALSTSEKAKVSNYNVLTTAEAAYKEYVNANAVDQKINGIGTVTLKSKDAIELAKKAYNALSANEKKKVTLYNTLLDAIDTYDDLAEAYEDEIRNVEDLIDAIGTVTKSASSKAKIQSALTAYNKLTEDQKAEVSNYAVLLAAKSAYEELLTGTGQTKSLTTTAKTSETSKTSAQMQTTKTDAVSASPEKVSEMLKNLPEQPQEADLLELLAAYESLPESEKTSLGLETEIEALKERYAKFVHTDKKTGINVSGCDWNIRLVVKEMTDVELIQKVQKKLNNDELLILWDIYLEDTLTGETYVPDNTVCIKIPMSVVENPDNYDGLTMLHYTEDGMLEYLNCTVISNCIVFHTIDFSYYAVAGYVGESPIDGTINEAPDAGTPWLPWVIGGGCGIVLLAALVLLMKKSQKEEQEK